MLEVIVLISIFVALGVTILVLQEMRERKQKQHAIETGNGDEDRGREENSEGCCGQHLVCERESLLNTSTEIVYYDDEELDAFAGKAQTDYTDEEIAQISEVFYSLLPEDVIGWLKSLQLRNIALPDCLRDEALMIVREIRMKQ